MNLKPYKLSPIIWVTIFGVFLSRIGISLSVPFLAIFLHFKIGISLTVTGLLIGASYLSYTFGGFIGGVLSDKYGRYRMLELSLAGYAVTFFLFGLSTYIAKFQLLITSLFFCLNLVAGLFRIWVDTLTQTLLSDLATKEQKFATFSIRFAAGNLGYAIGPVLGAIMGVSGNLQGFYFTGVMCIVYLLLFIFTTRKLSSVRIKKPIFTGLTPFSAARVLWHDKALIYYILSAIIVFGVCVQQESTLGQILVQRLGSAHLYSTLLSLNAIITVCLQIILTHWLLTKMNFIQLMKTGCVFIAIGLCGMAFAGPHVWVYILSQIVSTFGEIFIFSVTALFIDEIAPPALRGTYFGVLGLQYFGKALGPLLGGILLQFAHATATLTIFAFIMLTAIALFDKSNKAYLAFKDSKQDCQALIVDDEVNV